METFFARYRNSLTLALVLLAQLVLLAVQVRPHLPGAAAADQAGVRVLRLGVSTVVTPPEKALHTGGLGVRGLWSSYIDLVGVKERNEQLEAENQQLQLEQAALAEDARQGERLQELLAFKQHYIDTTMPAQVVGASGSDHERIVNIDKGSDDGISPGMPVITPDGIVGRVRDVAPHASQVLEISDPTSATGVLLEATRTRGILRGDMVGHPEIVNVMPDDRIKAGQLVLTSGGDQVFPRGLPVGVVDKIVPDVDNQPLVDVILKPAANLSRLEEVLVVTGTASVPTARARQDLAKSEGAAAAIKAAANAKAAEAAAAALEAQRASDVLAARLPSASNVENPDAPDAAPGASPATADSAAAPLHPPAALHTDHYSPGTAAKAEDLIPGARMAPLAEGVPDTERAAKTQGALSPAPPHPAVSPAFRAAHDASLAARSHAGPTLSASTAPEQVRAANAAARPTTARAASSALPVQAAARAAGALPAPGGFRSDPGVAGGAARRPAAVTPAAGAPARTSAPARNAAGMPAGMPPSKSRPAAYAGVPTHVVDDGPLPAARQGQVSSPAPIKAGAEAPARRTGPEIVPDDGSRPPVQTRPAPPRPAPTQSASPQEPR